LRDFYAPVFRLARFSASRNQAATRAGQALVRRSKKAGVKAGLLLHVLMEFGQ
jgi:hypothetical protein